MVGRCISYWNSPFLWDMLVFGVVIVSFFPQRWFQLSFVLYWTYRACGHFSCEWTHLALGMVGWCMQENLSSGQKNSVVILHRLVKNALGSKPLPEVLQRIYSNQSTSELTSPLLRRHLFEEPWFSQLPVWWGWYLSRSIPSKRKGIHVQAILYQRGDGLNPKQNKKIRWLGWEKVP